MAWQAKGISNDEVGGHFSNHQRRIV